MTLSRRHDFKKKLSVVTCLPNKEFYCVHHQINVILAFIKQKIFIRTEHLYLIKIVLREFV